MEEALLFEGKTKEGVERCIKILDEKEVKRENRYAVKGGLG